jgi:hypothetical protein
VDATATAAVSGIEIRGLNISGLDNAIDVTVGDGANSVGVTDQRERHHRRGLEGIDVNAAQHGHGRWRSTTTRSTANGTGIDVTRTAAAR